MNPVLPAQALLLITRDPSLSQVNFLPILLCGNLYSLYEEQRELLSTIWRGVREASRSHYNPKAASKSHLLPPKLQLLRVAFRFFLSICQVSTSHRPAIQVHKDCDCPFYQAVELSKIEAFKTILSSMTSSIEIRYLCRILKSEIKPIYCRNFLCSLLDSKTISQQLTEVPLQQKLSGKPTNNWNA